MVGHPFSFNGSDPMGPLYATIFYTMIVFTCWVAWKSRPTGLEELSPKARMLRFSYLTVWYICVAGDWLQGPYVYALYQAYGFARAEIAQLFVAGFGASMVFGTFVGSLGDTIGRKRSCQLYCALYILSCMTKHFSAYWVLMLGRITGGIATSLLFSGFESWLVAEGATRLQLDNRAMGHIFAMMWFGNSVVAIISGVAGDAMVGMQTMQPVGPGAMFHYGGYTSPFDLAIVLLVVGFLLISLYWTENYADSEVQVPVNLCTQVREGVMAIARSWQLLTVMLMVSCFEGSMYTFVFNWTPALQNKLSNPPFGMVFATFMMAYMCGSCCFDVLRIGKVSTLALAQGAIALGALSFAAAGMANSTGPSVSAMLTVYLGFLVFEFCVGLYFPAISLIKSQVVPEGLRSTIYNLYRLPMNAIVLGVLLTNVSIVAVFLICFALLTMAGSATLGFQKAAAAGHGSAEREGLALESAQREPAQREPAQKQQTAYGATRTA